MRQLTTLKAYKKINNLIFFCYRPACQNLKISILETDVEWTLKMETSFMTAGSKFYKYLQTRIWIEMSQR